MALAVDATSSGVQSGTQASPAVVAHTISGSNTVLVVAFLLPRNRTSVVATYNGVAMTQLVAGSTGNPPRPFVFVLVNPTTGANNISISWAGGNAGFNMTAVSFNGALQTDPTSSGALQWSNANNFCEVWQTMEVAPGDIAAAIMNWTSTGTVATFDGNTTSRAVSGNSADTAMNLLMGTQAAPATYGHLVAGIGRATVGSGSSLDGIIVRVQPLGGTTVPPTGPTTPTVDAVSGGGSAGSVASLTVSHTVGTGPGRVLVVGVAQASGANQTVTVTYDGVAMTSILTKHWDVNVLRLTVFYMVAPPVGAANIVATPSANDVMVLSAVSLFGADGAGFRASDFSVAAGTGTTTVYSSAPASISGDLGLLFAANGPSVPIAGYGLTNRVNAVSTTTVRRCGLFTMPWTAADGATMAMRITSNSTDGTVTIGVTIPSHFVPTLAGRRQALPHALDEVVLLRAPSVAPFGGDNPPWDTRHVLLQLVRALGEPPDQMAGRGFQSSPAIPGFSVDRPPVSSRVVLLSAIRQWDPPDPGAQHGFQSSSGIPGFSVDPPPRRTWQVLRQIVDAWLPVLDVGIAPLMPTMMVPAMPRRDGGGGARRQRGLEDSPRRRQLLTEDELAVALGLV
jgi:hypothetical protein